MQVNGKEHILTLEEAIRGHRAMWNWIAKQLKIKDSDNPNARPDEYRHKLKRQFLNKFGVTGLNNCCFACEFAADASGGHFVCEYCPFIWEKDGLYKRYSEDNMCCCKPDTMEENDKYHHWVESDPEVIANLPINPIYLCCALQGGNENGK